jgi:hypothetical protein
MTEAEREVPEGYRLEWYPDDDWQIGGDGRVCRMTGCKNPAVASLKRSRRIQSGYRNRQNSPRWHYCADHLYGRKIENGVIVFQRLVRIDEV